ncbi:pianissimo A [Thecamonas trahens ATCC 50062]|uniref:peptidylprolyl isomerase n=1 Tax=Thecamonas trahens ATCC 50062 TaxID=461836 RepID=A0A0L0DGG5_THETB|nr:pianissimo A [Thecamonas trahens ATCC 50062]KNC51424.1 pianissimo A [Thecamonas trahens ATCC 50062]|eukprot:XP_013756088.1 pianissimo A [Thecamonas trahens ATCC 50062]
MPRQEVEVVIGARQGAVKGWDLGVRGMTVGENRRLVVPPAYAYGEHGSPSLGVPPDTELAFDIELVELTKEASTRDRSKGKSRQASAVPPRTKLALLDALCGLHSGKLTKALSEHVAPQAFVMVLRPLCVDPVKAIRAATLRTLRYFARDKEVIEAMLAAKIHVFVGLSLEKDAKHEMERMQAMKLVRKLIEVHPEAFPRSLAVSLVAIATHVEDAFCRVCLESLCELVVRNARVVALAGGIKTLIEAIHVKKFEDIVEPLTLTLMYLLNGPEARQYVLHHIDMGTVLSPLTDTYTAHDPDVVRKRAATVRALLAMLRSWPGLIGLSSLQHVGLSSVVSALCLEDESIRYSVLDLLFRIFRLRKPPRTSSFPAALKAHSASLVHKVTELSRVHERFSLSDAYMAALLVGFVSAGLVEALVSLGICDDRELAVQVTILLGELLHMANKILPHGQCAQLQTLPSLVATAAEFRNQDDPFERSRANTLLSSLHEFARVRKLASEYTDFHMQLLLLNTYKTRRREGTDSTGASSFNDHIKNLKVKLEASMDDKSFDALLKSTQIFGTKDFTKWHWDVIAEVIEGPLSDVRRMEECITRTKFAKRILSFLRPSNHQFSDMRIDKRNKHKNLRYIRTACSLLDALMASDEGARYLAENELLDQIAEFCRAEVAQGAGTGTGAGDGSGSSGGGGGGGGSSFEPGPGVTLSDRFLEKNRLTRTMTREYFTMLGVLSSTKRGQDLLEQKELFNVLYPLTDGARGREDLAKLIVTSLDYNLNGHPRVLLAKAMTCKNRNIRYIATRHMRVLLRAGVSDFPNWGTDLLVTQLNDSDKDISATALKILVESCEDADTLATLISKRPLLATLEGKGKDILLRFLSSPAGFGYLTEHAWIESEMAHWHAKGNLEYVNSLEVALAKSLQKFLFGSTAGSGSGPSGSGGSKGRSGSGSNDEGTTTVLRPHFYGELAKTSRGVALLAESGHINEFLAHLASDETHIVYRKSALWALGHIAASDSGYAFLADDGAGLGPGSGSLIDQVVGLAEGSDRLSLKGTAYFVLGLVSMSEAAASELALFGWEANGTKGICVPREPEAFLSIVPSTYCGLWAESAENDPSKQLDPDDDRDAPTATPRPGDDEAEFELAVTIPRKIIDAVGKLSNHITADSASRELKTLKRSEETAFLFNEPNLLQVPVSGAAVCVGAV